MWVTCRSFLIYGYYELQANPGSGVSAADLVQTSTDGAGDKEGARYHYTYTFRAARPLACSCE